MRDIQAGKLPAKGGGRGRVPYKIALADVEAFRRRHSGVADADLLARIAYAFQQKRRHPGKFDYWLNAGFLMLWQWRKSGQENLIEGFCRNGLPALAVVSPAVRDWARRIVQDLTPAEVDYLAAMFIVTEHPVAHWTGAASRAWAETVKRIAPRFHVTKPRLDSRVAQTLWLRHSQKRCEVKTCPHCEYEKAKGERNAAFEFVTAAYHGRTDLLSADTFTGLDSAGLAILDKAGKPVPPSRFQELNGLLSDIREWSRRTAKAVKNQGRAKPSGATVADVLGIRRFQATRLWRGEKARKGIVQKIGPDGIIHLAGMLSLDAEQVPRAWKAALCPRAKDRRQAQPSKDAESEDIATFLAEEADRMARAGRPK
jgi:hypothetical protein